MGQDHEKELTLTILWTKQARSNLQSIYEFILPENPSAALQQVHRIQSSVDRLSLFPEIGRVGRITGTREMVVSKTEYIAVYRIRASAVRILAIRHAAQQWPQSFGG